MSTAPSNNPAALAPSQEEQVLETSFKKLVWLALLIVAALAAWGLISHNQRLAAEAAAEAFTKAKTIEDCNLVIKNHAGTPAAGNALLLKASLHWEKNEKSSCVEALQQFLKDNATHPAYPQTLLAVASKQEAMGDKAAAKTSFERVLNEQAGTDLAQLAQIRLGDMLWSEGKADEAKKAYEDATAKFPGIATFEEQSKARLDWITAGLPTQEVDAPAPPPPLKVPTISSGIPGLPEMKLTSGIAPPSEAKSLDAVKPANISVTPTPTPAATTPAPAVPQMKLPEPAPVPAVPKSATSPPVEVPASKPAPAPAPAAEPKK